MRSWRKEGALPQLKFIISGGGTGGHIFPAIAIANALRQRVPDAEFLFVGANGRMEMEKVPAAGYKIVGLNIVGLQRKLTVKNLAFPFKVVNSILKAKKIFREFKPDAVIGTGGYASGPMLRVASKKGIVTLIQEQNSFPGITNKILSRKVDRVCVAYDGMDKFFPKEKVVFTGNPVRQDIQNMEGKKARAAEIFNIDPKKKTVLVIGGSLGARTINESIYGGLKMFANNNIQLIWQTGKNYFPTAEKAVRESNQTGIHAYEFISKMDYAYAAADVVVSRAGASSVSELCLVHKPCILVPSPNVAEDHQTKNAMALVNHHAAILVKDAEANDQLVDALFALLRNKPEQEKLSVNISKLAVHNSADLIASEVLSLINKRKKK
ncbi:MAG TPA: undecaprenyldiphospho-muramoylpentapeptide beta-N-acetylglucosaminyltransferase [Bacteroidia bacterium]|jgi:UDP-N-acetylglucosamine--N-acetylmuramyl-(pentapeptide) pyrophosphoryl-undecaprenol N-acetylglucosamine transferase|nr:undecaprenyldiphospho-muramoylpentapeptide beta-N-acetylglucosaminyltransferase [Bacteroidia bacterium]